MDYEAGFELSLTIPLPLFLISWFYSISNFLTCWATYYFAAFRMVDEP